MDNKELNKAELIPFSLSESSLETYLLSISSKSKIIYWIIILMVIAGLSVLPIVKVDVSIQASGYFQSDIEKQQIFSTSPGKVMYTSIRNGQEVNKGDTLLIIDSESRWIQYKSLLQRISENNASAADLERVIRFINSSDSVNRPVLQTKRYKAEFENFLSQSGIQFEKFQKRQTEHNRNEVLYHQQLVPKADYENSLFAQNSEKDNLDQLRLGQVSLWQNDLTLRKSEAISLLADLKQCFEDIRNRVILAPTNGEVIQSSDIQAGSNLSSGQKIAEISPRGTLHATCFVRPQDIGFIHEKQKVKIQVDAFNHNEWGMLNGEIIDISDDMLIENGSTAYFRIKCKPEKTFLSLKNGYRAEIKKGMSVNTRIFVIRRSLYHLLFDKADKWFNPYTYSSEKS